MNTIKPDEYFMRCALTQAQKAFAQDEVPIGAVVVSPEGIVIGKGYNCVEKKQQQVCHAEIIAIGKAAKKMNNWRLNDCTIYSTLEPCAMCMNLIILSRVKKLVFAATSPVYGYQLDKEGINQLYRRNMLEIVQGVKEEESVLLLKTFFKNKREQGNGSKKLNQKRT